MADVRKIDEAKAPCCYCGEKKDHFDFTCPRIGAVEIDEKGTTVHFHDPEVWENYLKSKK